MVRLARGSSAPSSAPAGCRPRPAGKGPTRSGLWLVSCNGLGAGATFLFTVDVAVQLATEMNNQTEGNHVAGELRPDIGRVPCHLENRVHRRPAAVLWPPVGLVDHVAVLAQRRVHEDVHLAVAGRLAHRHPAAVIARIGGARVVLLLELVEAHVERQIPDDAPEVEAVALAAGSEGERESTVVEGSPLGAPEDRAAKLAGGLV